jgi:hypothetical protein
MILPGQPVGGDNKAAGRTNRKEEGMRETPTMRKLVLWVPLGFAAVLFLGPVLALAAAVLPFIFVGFVVWLVLHLLSGRRCRPWPHLDQARRHCVRVSEAVLRDLWRAGQSLQQTGRRLGTFVLEGFSGSVVGGVLALVRDPEHPPTALALLAGAALGGLLGVLVALSHLRLARPAREAF